MPLAPATRLGPYEIVAPLGAGGMGEVYRARDPRLGREVALKVLPTAMALDPARRARFEQEARAAAALSHPNIVGLHDVGEASDIFYIVSELVPGETLEAIIQRGPVPVKKLLDIAVQIADGMAAAHAARITHRDLKPANIMLTPDGRAKILDFGLAKQAASPTATSPDDTLTVAQQTEPGMIMGTVAYMSPEQARGKPADHRSDQFSFGLILYEMAEGRKAFHKPEAVQVMAAILTEDPAPIERNIPAPLRWAIDRCLAKDPADRYESTRDLYQDLRHVRDHLSETTTSQSVVRAPAARLRRIRWQWPVIAVLGLAAAAAAGLFLAGPKLPDQSRYSFTPFAFDPIGQAMPLWSPDGKAVAYAGYVAASRPDQVFVRYLDSPAPIQITAGPDSAEPVAWAPDSKRVIFRSARQPAGLWSVSTVGGEPESFMPMERTNSFAVSPDLKSVAIMRKDEDGVFAVWISSPPGAAPRKYMPNPMATRTLFNSTILRFSPDGKRILLFMRGDRGRTEAWLIPYPSGSSAPRLVLPDVTPYNGTPLFSWMPDSRRVVLAFASSPVSSSQLWLADPESRQRVALTSGTAGHSDVDVSPDGRRIVFTDSAVDYDLASVDLQHATASPLIATQRNEYMAAWAAKQPALVYVTDRNGPHEIWLHSAGTDRPVVTPRDFPPGTTQWFLAPALSPDGGRLIYERFEIQGGGRLWISAISGGSPVPLTNAAGAAEFPGSWSPDGNWFVYLSVGNGKRDLMKVKTTGQASPVMVRHDIPGGEVPVFSPDGAWILAGNELCTPDGQQVRPLGKHGSPTYAFSTDSKLLYGIRHDGDRNLLFSLDVAGGAEKVLGDLGRDFAPASNFSPAIRFSLSVDGNTFVYSVATRHSNLWMFEGFQ